MKQIFTILFVIFSIIPIQSAALSTSDVPSIIKSARTNSTILAIPKLVESVCEKLKNRELTFDSQIPEKVYSRFISGMEQASIVLAEKNPSRKEILEVLQTKAQNLYATKQLTSMWLMYLGLGCAKLLSKFDEPLSLPLGCSTFAEELDIFTLVHNHHVVLREPMLKWRQEIRPSLSAWPESKFTHELLGNTSLSYDICVTLNNILHTDCFWLPIISRKPLFSPATFNRALVHRVALVGIPLEATEGFDGIQKHAPMLLQIMT